MDCAQALCYNYPQDTDLKQSLGESGMTAVNAGLHALVPYPNRLLEFPTRRIHTRAFSSVLSAVSLCDSRLGRDVTSVIEEGMSFVSQMSWREGSTCLQECA
jgi:hypothetical protein